MEAAPKKKNPAVSLTDDLLVEILRRLPVRSVCRFKCVSRSWRNLISDPVHRKKLPHTLEGFFYHSWNGKLPTRQARHFTNVTGKGVPFIFPSFCFLPVPSNSVVLVDSCNGLLLCRCYERDPDHGDWSSFQYAVCNPATKKWLLVPDCNPDSKWAPDERTARLGFDPTVSSHFHVIEYVVDVDECCVIGFEIYSSKTAAWSFKESEYDNNVIIPHGSRSVFLNGSMHMLTYFYGIVTVNMEGKTWIIPMPSDVDGGCCIHEAQGRLCFLNSNFSKLSIWILEDYGTHEWTLKHTITTLQMFRQKNVPFDMSDGYEVIAFHPECNLIFFVCGWDNTLVAYEMDRKEVRIIRKLGREYSGPYLPYVPLFMESLAEQ